MLQKILSGRSLALIAVILALTATMVQAAATYTYEGTLVEIKDRNITVVNNEEKVVIHAVVPPNIHLAPAFTPGDKVFMVLTKTNYGLWNVVKMRKIN
ncbi:MAG: hypothetical protein Q4F00_11635 [bacterium]|nr:hypothetical protein [bacterium]